jgi:iron complex outermembrane receptor protein
MRQHNTLNYRTLLKALPSGIAFSVLACAINSAFAADVTDLGAVGASGSAGAATSASAPAAAKAAPIQSSLDARSAQSIVSDEFIQNFTSPVADYSQILQMAPGMYNYSPNGVGLGDTATTMRGYSDSNAVIAFDGIPFNDTNGVSHHSWAFFPSQFVGGAVIDRSPGSAATIGQATFAGNINLLSRNLEPQKRTSVELSDGSWNTTLVGAEYETGQFGADGASNLMVNAHEMKSDGYQTYNNQKTDAISAKYQYIVSPDTAVTAFVSYEELHNNTPSVKGVTRANVNLGNYNLLLSGDPTSPAYYGNELYHIYTDFNYIGITSNLGNGWKVDDKAYVYRYWNKQNYNNFSYDATGLIPTNPAPTVANLAGSTGVDKLNSYVTMGNIFRATKDFTSGTLRTGLWYDDAKSFRYQTPTVPGTWQDAATPNFNETYTTTTMQPYFEYEFKVADDLKVTPGIKYASYRQDFNHLADNGKAVGPVPGGTGKIATGVGNLATCAYNKTTGLISGPACQPSVSNGITYTDVLPSLDAHYQLQQNWSVYGQYAEGDAIPPTNVFDVANAAVLTPPKATKSKTFQVGSVFKSDEYTLDVDVYHTHLDSPWSSVTDKTTGEPVWTMNGGQINQGIEAESTILLDGGFSLYLNSTFGSAKYDTGLWVAGAPEDTETLGLNYKQGEWDASLISKRVGKMYNDGLDGNGNAVNQAFIIDPCVITNLFVNYTLKNPVSYSKQAKIQLAVNNLLNDHGIVGVAGPSKSSTSAAPNVADLLTITPARSVSLTLKLDF